MLLSIILKLVSLLLISCHVFGKEEKKHNLRYQFGDWQPHFGYVPGHMASAHNLRPKPVKKSARNLSYHIKKNDSLPLDNYVVRLLRNEHLICTGVVVGMQEVLTSKMCLKDVALADIEVKLFDGSIHKVADSRKTKDFAIGVGQDLMEILILENNLDKEFNKTIPVCRTRVTFSDKVEMLTWNHKNWQLKKTPVRQISALECKQLLNDTAGQIITQHVSCLENEHSGSVCEKNYGLPYVWNGQICGINLLGHNCLGESKADVYLKVVDLPEFLKRKTDELEKAKVDRAMP